MNIRKHAFASAAVLATLAGTLTAQSSTWSPLPGQPSQPAQPAQPPQPARARSVIVHAQPEVQHDSHAVFIQKDGHGEVRVEIKGGDVRATHNGKPLPADRVKHGQGGVKVLGENGDVIASFEHVTTPQSGAFGGGRAAPRVFAVPGDSGPFGVSTTIDDQPRTILGVTLSDTATAVRDHFGLTESAGVTIESVMEGYPAQDAGLQVGDIVIAVDGQDGINQDKFREIIGSKKPSDKVKLTVIRKGDRLTIASGLKEFKQEGVEVIGGNIDVAPAQIFDMHDPDMQKHMEEAFKKGWLGADRAGSPFTVYSDDGKMFTWSMPPGGAFQNTTPPTFGPGQVDDLRKEMEELRAALQQEREAIKEELAAIRRILSELSKDR